MRVHVGEKAGRHKHPRAGSIDSQSVKMTLVPRLRNYDVGKMVMGRKRHLLVDTLGLTLSLKVTSVSALAPVGAKVFLKSLGGFCKGLCKIWADCTYQGQPLRSEV